jgi:hypothetical protein
MGRRTAVLPQEKERRYHDQDVRSHPRSAAHSYVADLVRNFLARAADKITSTLRLRRVLTMSTTVRSTQEGLAMKSKSKCAHRETKQVGEDRCFSGCVSSRDCNPMSHGNIVYTVVCSKCGAQRNVACNGGHAERGSWMAAK